MLLAVEDAVSEAIARKLVASVRPDLRITAARGRQGSGYLRGRARELNRSAAAMRVLLLTDLDSRATCPADVIMSWFGTAVPNIIARVAVMEVESWVLADRAEAATFLGVPSHRIPADTDGIDDPKLFLVNLARRSRSMTTRDQLVPAAGSTAIVGPAYNPRVTEFVQRTWDPARAAVASESLRRAIGRVRVC